MTRPPQVHVAIINEQIVLQFASGQVIAVLQTEEDTAKLVDDIAAAASSLYDEKA